MTIDYLVNADELQIKVAQGAKPGEGGQLPGHKVDRYIASLRHSTPGVGLISPPPHHDIYSIEDLKQLIYDLRCANPRARVRSSSWPRSGVGTIAAGVAKANADHVIIAGHDGGTGASPQSSIQHAGRPVGDRPGRDPADAACATTCARASSVQTDGQMRTGRDVVVAALLGADEFGFSTAAADRPGLHHDARLPPQHVPGRGSRRRTPSCASASRAQPEHVVNYFFFVAEEVRRILARLGLRTLEELIGRADLLEADDAVDHWKARGRRPLRAARAYPRCRRARRAGAARPPTRCSATTSTHELIEAACAGASPARSRSGCGAPIRNVQPHGRRPALERDRARARRRRACRRTRSAVDFHGSAGQCFGAWLAPGVYVHAVRATPTTTRARA